MTDFWKQILVHYMWNLAYSANIVLTIKADEENYLFKFEKQILNSNNKLNLKAKHLSERTLVKIKIMTYNRN